MKRPSKERLERLRRAFQPGMRVRLVRMEDVQAPPAGTCGTVLFVDDLGSIHIAWDTGGNLAALDGEDMVERLSGDSGNA
ncbi:DUF4314 domain-containing protein [Selenomonas bovis]|uniref:DUF4314 domain-containing protein n=1 Tax=Selenomonas bovis TaxID=416586 RepID=UPI003D073F82